MGGIWVIAGRYRLERQLGRGNMGAVWLATDEVLGRQVALKQLTPLDGVGHRAIEREAQLAARLVHPNVVAVFDLVKEGNEDPWLVMEYVEGTTLARLVRDEGPLPVERAADVIKQIAAALRSAHAAGVVHRDVKPSNILVEPGGRAKLTDFGIARGLDSEATQTGQVTGSPAYLAPEIAVGGRANPASDMWALGATLYQALTGGPPYGVGDNALATLYRIVHEDPPRTERAGRLAPLLEHTMHRDPAQRWTAPEVLDFLAGQMPVRPEAAAERTQTMQPLAASAAAPTTAPPAPREPRPRRRPAWLPVALVALVALLVGVGGWALAHRGSHPAATDHPSGTPSASVAAKENRPVGRAKPSPTSSPTSSTSSTTDGPSADGVDQFVRTYLATVTSDPNSAYDTMLTSSFQAHSGGRSGYLGWWTTVAHASADWVRPTLDPLTVSYQYSYVMKDGSAHTDTVSLGLVYVDGHYLIDHEA